MSSKKFSIFIWIFCNALLVTIITVHSVKHDLRPKLRIVGVNRNVSDGGGDGKYLNISSLPYHVSIELEDEHWCSGIILQNNVILTTAKCIYELLTDDLRIRIGVNRVSSFHRKVRTGQLLQIRKSIIHPNFTWQSSSSSSSLDYDFGILILRDPIIFKLERIGKIDLPKNDNYINDLTVKQNLEVITSGWGYRKSDGSFGDNLIYIKLPLLNVNECGNNSSKRILCANYLKSRTINTCDSDKGGPIILNDVLIGINSGGIGCEKSKQLALFTLILPDIKNWINQILIENYIYSSDSSSRSGK